MIQIDLATLVKRLNPFAKQALEMAASGSDEPAGQ